MSRVTSLPNKAQCCCLVDRLSRATLADPDNNGYVVQNILFLMPGGVPCGVPARCFFFFFFFFFPEWEGSRSLSPLQGARRRRRRARRRAGDRDGKGALFGRTKETKSRGNQGRWRGKLKQSHGDSIREPTPTSSIIRTEARHVLFVPAKRPPAAVPTFGCRTHQKSFSNLSVRPRVCRQPGRPNTR